MDGCNTVENLWKHKEEMLKLDESAYILAFDLAIKKCAQEQAERRSAYCPCRHDKQWSLFGVIFGKPFQ
jgi:hypothetical protein